MEAITDRVRELGLLRLQRKYQCERSFFEFAKDAFEVIHYGEKMQVNWHIKEICNILQAKAEALIAGEPGKGIIINVPPRSLKSFIAAMAWPAWIWTKAPRIKIFGSSYSDTLSTEHNVKCRRIIESDWYRGNWHINIMADQNEKRKFENTQGGARLCTSTGGTATGLGGDIGIIDDPLNPKKAKSEVDRKSANDHFDLTLSTRLNNPTTSFFVVVMQRLHEMDLTGHLLAKAPEEWDHICFPAEVSNHVKPEKYKANYKDGLLFPERFTHKFLQKKRVDLGSNGYANQFSQLAVADEGSILKRNWFPVITWEKFLETKGETPVIWHFFVDTSYTDKTENDPNAILAACRLGMNMYIRNSVSKHLELPELVKYIISYVPDFGYSPQSKIYVEPKASGKSTVQTLRSMTSLNVVEDESPTDNKITRVSSISPRCEAGRVILIDGSWNSDFLDEVCKFPLFPTDDKVDTLVMGVNRLIIKPVSSSIKLTLTRR